MELVTLGVGYSVDSSVSRRIVNEDVGFLSRPSSTHKHSFQAFMYMSMMTIQSKSNLLYVLLLGQTSMVIAYTSIILNHLSKTNEKVPTLGRFI